jgi:hypothetical protein
MGVSVKHSPMIVNGTKDPLRRVWYCPPGKTEDEGEFEDDYDFRTRGRRKT